MFSNVFKKKNKGFVMIEMIVSVGIFATVMTIGIGSLLSVISANRKAQAYKVVINNINLAMESMSRELRTGYDYNCGGLDCSSGVDTIYFTSKDGVDMVYRFYDNAIQKSVDGSAFVSMTSSEIAIDELVFYVIGYSGADTLQPRILITVGGHTGNKVSEGTSFNLQTTVTQRVLDLSS